MSLQEGVEYIAMANEFIYDFSWNNDDVDGNAIEIAFSAEKMTERKLWLIEEDVTEVDPKERIFGFSKFMSTSVRNYGKADLKRSIPSLMDGLKSTQRKVVYCGLRKLKEVSVDSLVGDVVETGYHHGRTSIVAAIFNLAQNYVGTNNINLLMPSSDFGSRVLGIKTKARESYLYTQVSPVTQHLFHKDDEPILNKLQHMCVTIEPEYVKLSTYNPASSGNEESGSRDGIQHVYTKF